MNRNRLREDILRILPGINREEMEALVKLVEEIVKEESDEAYYDGRAQGNYDEGW